MQCYIEKWPDRERTKLIRNPKKSLSLHLGWPKMALRWTIARCLCISKLGVSRANSWTNLNPFGIHFGRYGQDQKTLVGLALFSDPGGWAYKEFIGYLLFNGTMARYQNNKIQMARVGRVGGTPAEISSAAALNRHTERETERQKDRETERQRDLGFS